jgi:hypothetical protein
MDGRAFLDAQRHFRRQRHVALDQVGQGGAAHDCAQMLFSSALRSGNDGRRLSHRPGGFPARPFSPNATFARERQPRRKGARLSYSPLVIFSLQKVKVSQTLFPGLSASLT